MNRLRGIFKNILGLCIRSFFGIGDFLGSNVFKKIIESWFKQMTWAILTSALLIFGLKMSDYGLNILMIPGVISIIFIIFYSISFESREIETEFRNSIEKVNKKNEKYYPLIKPYSTSPMSSAGITVLCIFFIINIITYCAIFYAIFYAFTTLLKF